MTTPLEEDRAKAMGNVHKKIVKIGRGSFEDMIAVRQTHTHTDTLITILRSAIGAE